MTRRRQTRRAQIAAGIVVGIIVGTIHALVVHVTSQPERTERTVVQRPAPAGAADHERTR
ncbi:MAG: hypothetical protein DIU54_001345 [Acidobacteriota bacterium]|jgi:hypothetical protein|nr:MAG: hypothetical protein DIU54_01285 [Acidobacteriota bacterium]